VGDVRHLSTDHPKNASAGLTHCHPRSVMSFTCNLADYRHEYMYMYCTCSSASAYLILISEYALTRVMLSNVCRSRERALSGIVRVCAGGARPLNNTARSSTTTMNPTHIPSTTALGSSGAASWCRKHTQPDLGWRAWTWPGQRAFRSGMCHPAGQAERSHSTERPSTLLLLH